MDAVYDCRSHFRPFVGDVINAMNLDICFNSLTIMEEEWGIIQAHKSFKATARPIVVKAGGSSLTVFRSTAVLVDAVQKYSVCALSSKDSLMPITASFVTCIKQQYIEMKNHLLKISRSVGHSCITSLLYPTLGSVMMLKNCLVKFLSKQEYKRYQTDTNCNFQVSIILIFHFSDFQVVINEMASVQQVILEQIFDSHKHILSTSVLFDDDSNIWTDSKPFHEVNYGNYSRCNVMCDGGTARVQEYTCLEKIIDSPHFCFFPPSRRLLRKCRTSIILVTMLMHDDLLVKLTYFFFCNYKCL